MLTKSHAFTQAKDFAKHFNCTEQWLNCLRRVDSQSINTHTTLWPRAIVETEFLPLMPQNAFQTKNFSAGIDIIAGVMQNEGSSLAPHPGSEQLKTVEDFKALIKRTPFPAIDVEKVTEFYLKGVDTHNPKHLTKAFYDYYGDVYITCPSYHFAKQFAQNTATNAFFYEWTYISSDLKSHPSCTEVMGVCHGSDVGYVFGSPLLHNSSETDKKFSAQVMTIWTEFVKTG